MKKHYSLAAILVILSLAACQKDNDMNVPNELSIPCVKDKIELDTVFLDTKSLEFIQYTGKEQLFFKNKDGEEAVFKPLNGQKKHFYFPINFNRMCEDGGTNSYFYPREQFSVGFECQNLNLRFYDNLYVFPSNETEHFVDNLNFLFHSTSTDSAIDTFILLEVITSFKGNEQILNQEFNNINKYELKNEIKLLDTTFTDVYRVIKPNDNILTELYFNKKNGLVGFRDLDLNLWVLDRIE